MRLTSIIAAATAGFAVGALWYGVFFADAYVALRGSGAGGSPAWSLVGEFGRCIVAASVLAHFVVSLNVDNVRRALKLALVVWGGFQLSMIFGSVLHENYPVALFVIHAGDALAKSLVMSVILMLGQKHPRRGREASVAERSAI